MIRDDILRMAREAGMPPVEIISDKPVLYPVPDAIERFYHAVFAAGEQAEREACARVCEMTYEGAFEGTRPCFDTPQECAAAIRARGEKK